MDHNAFFDLIKKGQFPSCCVMEGTEDYVKRSALDMLRAKLLPKGMEQMNETVLTDPDADTIIASAETQPFLADKRLVVVRESAMLGSQTKGKTYDEASSTAKMLEYLPTLPDTCCLVFFAGDKTDGRKKLPQWLKKNAQWVTFSPLGEAEMNRWIAQQFKRLDKKITMPVCQKLVFSAGSDLTLLHSEIEKLAAFTGEREEITEQDVGEIAVRTTAYRVYDLTGALTRGDSKRAFSLSQALQKDGEEPLALLSLLQAECRRMLSAKLLKGSGMNADQAAVKLSAPPFAVRQLYQTVQRYTEEQLKQMCDICMDTEYQVKSGRMPQHGALEKAMLLLLRVRTEAGT